MEIWNFSAGPGMLPKEVLIKAQKELRDWNGLGVSVMEMSHRSAKFEELAVQIKNNLRALLNLPSDFEIIFSSGGAQAHFALLPMNLLNSNEVAAYLISGYWSAKAATEAKRFAQIEIAADARDYDVCSLPKTEDWNIPDCAKYLHYATNETIDGLQLHQVPSLNIPLIADMSSDFLSAPIEDFSPFEVIYASAQKNIGAAGLTVILIRKTCLKSSAQKLPKVFEYQNLAMTSSMPNTPPTYIWYLTGLVLEWLEKQGGTNAIALRNQEKAHLLYETIDSSSLYLNRVEKKYRSVMNVIFDLPTPELVKKFLDGAESEGLLGLKGHKARGGIRASIYNAMPLEGVEALVKFMKNFEAKN